MNMIFRSSLVLATLLCTPSGAAGAGGQGSAGADSTITLPGGTTLALREVEGRLRLLHFFNGTCARCKNDDRLLRELAFEYADQGVVLLNVFRRPALKRYTVSGEALTPQVSELSDSTGALARRYGLGLQAGTVFMDRQGRVVAQLPDGVTTTAILNALRKTLSTSSP